MPTTKDQLDAAKAQETEGDLDDQPDPYVEVPLAGFDGVTKDVRALPVTKWRASAMRALNGSDMDTFFRLVLHEDDYELYEELDPDFEAVQHFAEKVAEKVGEDLGKSGGPSRSGRSTRRR